MIAAVILAAGASSRFGSPKGLLEFEGRTLLSRTIRCARKGGCDPVVLVLGADAERCRGEAVGDQVQVVVNPEWDEGMGSSIRAGISALAGRAEIRGALLLTCDQPLLTSSLVVDLRTAFEDLAADSPRSAVVCGYAGTRGIPALFGASVFAALQRLRGDRGAKTVLDQEVDQVCVIEWPDGAVDIDRPEDYEDLLGRS